MKRKVKDGKSDFIYKKRNKASMSNLLNDIKITRLDFNLLIMTASGWHFHTAATRLSLSEHCNILKGLTAVVKGDSSPC